MSNELLFVILIVVAVAGALVAIHWDKRSSMIVPIDGGMTAKMRIKDPQLYAQIANLPIHKAWPIWKEVHPEDFPQNGLTIVGPGAIKP